MQGSKFLSTVNLRSAVEQNFPPRSFCAEKNFSAHPKFFPRCSHDDVKYRAPRTTTLRCFIAMQGCFFCFLAAVPLRLFRYASETDSSDLFKYRPQILPPCTASYLFFIRTRSSENLWVQKCNKSFCSLIVHFSCASFWCSETRKRSQGKLYQPFC